MDKNFTRRCKNCHSLRLTAKDEGYFQQLDSDGGSSDNAADGRFGARGIIYIWKQKKGIHSSSGKHGKPPQTPFVPRVSVRRQARRARGNGQPDPVAQHSSPHKRTLCIRRVHTRAHVHACARPSTRTRPRVDATDNMQLRAVSSTLSCPRSVRALSPVERLRHAWRKRREHAEYADNETGASPRDAARTTSIDGKSCGGGPSPASSSNAPSCFAINRSTDCGIVGNPRVRRLYSRSRLRRWNSEA